MKKSFFILMVLMSALCITAQEELTSAEAKSLVKNTSKQWVSIHDPSVVWEPSSQRYYIFGSHKAGAYTTDMQNWTQANPSWTPSSNSSAFTTPEVKKVKKGGQEVDFPQFNAMEWSARTDASYDVNGNMWAPDVIWNEKMQKWCMYLSINGDAWHSSIILLTSSNIIGPYKYQGPVVICGFQDNGHSYKGTDLELVLGTQNSLPSRYAVGNGWGRRWPHTIDPAVFYDEEGKLWLVYGSWSGGIWMLELDEETGLRDYDVVYPSTNGTTDGVTSDPYFGTKIGGGYYVSGEGPYIEHIGQYYYLFVSYGGFAPDGGYEMRVFRSEKPNGPYKDASNRSAIFTGYVLNYGTGSETRGEKLMGSYNNWGNMTVGECAQGHNSVIAAHDGRTYLVYHTKFNNGTAGHQVRVHQLFLNKNGWLVAAPFEYNGGQLTDNDIATRELFTNEQIAGNYQVLIHKYKMDHNNMEEVTPINVTLGADGTVTGDRTGTWAIDPGTSYFKLTLSGLTYNGVIIEQQLDGKTVQTVSFSVMASNGVNIWGYKTHPKYLLAEQLNNQSVAVKDNQTINQDIDLYAGMNLGLSGVTVSWKSSEPGIISDYGKYNPEGLTENTPVTLTARAETPGYYWQQQYNVKANAYFEPVADWQTGMVAHYGFDNETLSNSFAPAEQAKLLRAGTTAAPALEEDPMRTGQVVHLAFGANGQESYVEMANPLFGQSLEESGAAISFWVKRTDNNLWDALFSFNNGNARFYMTGNSYLGYNSGAGIWLDINHPNDVTPANILTGRWQLVTLSITKTGITLYVGGTKKSFAKFNGEQTGTTITTEKAFDYSQILKHLEQCQTFCLGRGSFWGSPDASFDDIIVYDHSLSFSQVLALSQMENRVFDFSSVNPDGIAPVAADHTDGSTIVSDLQGRRVQTPTRGLYIVNGRKVLVK